MNDMKSMRSLTGNSAVKNPLDSTMTDGRLAPARREVGTIRREVGNIRTVRVVAASGAVELSRGSLVSLGGIRQ